MKKYFKIVTAEPLPNASVGKAEQIGGGKSRVTIGGIDTSKQFANPHEGIRIIDHKPSGGSDGGLLKGRFNR